MPAALSAAVPAGRGVRVVQSDGSGVVVEFRPGYLAPEKIGVDGTVYDHYTFEGGRTNEVPKPGAPDLPSRAVTVRLPALTGATVEIVNADYEDLPQTLIAPFAAGQEGEVDPPAVYKLDQPAYSSAEFLPKQIVLLTNVGATQGSILGNLLFQPLQYNARLHTLRKYSRIVARVNFGDRMDRTGKQSSLSKNIAVNEAAFGSAAGNDRAQRPAIVSQSSVLSTGVWFRFPVTEDGIYKFRGADLLAAGVPPSTDPSTIKIYGNGGYETPLSVSAPAVDDLLENALFVDDGGAAGQLDASDAIVFFAKSTRGWTYNSGAKTFSHYINHYADVNYYWLTYGGASGKRVARVPSISDPSAYSPQTVISKIFREDDKVNLISSGIEWLGQPFNVGDQITYVHQLDGIDVSRPVNYKFRVGARSSGFSSFSFDEHAQRLTVVGLPGTDFDTYSPKLSAATVVSQAVPAFTDGRSQLKFTFQSNSASSNGYIDWYEIMYSRFLRAQNGQFSFHTYDTSSILQYDIAGFSGGSQFVFDVTRFDSVVQITNPRISGDTCSFGLSSGGVRELYVLADGSFKVPGSLSRIANEDLHGDTTQADFIIITHADFISAAQRLKHYREQPGDNYIKTNVVDVQKIYNEFGGGLLTPAAIRNYLRYVNTHWQTPPKYVLLLGDGNYDYKNIVSQTTNWVPPWETEESFVPLSSYSVDDEYVLFDTGDRIGMSIGRLTAHSAGEANTMVDKIIEYETNPVIDPWRARLTFVADDGLTGAGERSDLFIHTTHAELVSRIAPPLFERRKIYLYDYPTEYTSAGRRKPEVNTAIVNQMNQGTVVLNFNGHGNPRVWTHEQVFVRETDFANLSNKGKYFFLVAATCNYSHFDMLNDQSGGEILTGMPGAGAIAVFSATRPVFAGENFELNSALDTKMFETGPSGNVVSQRLGDIVYFVKQIYTYENDRKYFLLGDPTLHLAFPKKFASLDSLNHVSLSQTGQLQALSTATLTATVHDSTATDHSLFNGTSQLTVYDANRFVELRDSFLITGTTFWIRDAFSYSATGNTLFRGEQSVSSGSINASFVVPKDISYGNDVGRMTLYFWNTSADGAGSTTNFRIGGTDTNAVQDHVGPKIVLFIDGRGFRPGDVVSPSPVLIADVFDSSGINTSGASVGHRLEAWLDESAQSIDLSDYYKGKTDTYREGTIQYPLGALSQGTHKLRLRAWDTYNNSSTTETAFDVVTSVGLRLTNVLNFPNPMQSSTMFTFEQNQLSNIDVEVKIFTVAGRLIQSLKKTSVSDAFVQIPWDGRDRDGDVPANGIYLYKIIAKTEDSRFTSEALGKLSILR
ncbi:MAG TPA: type IX secretion system sortase PorU [Bacteroidota bacterium]|nr:type IX secretion system sortase PorU [Bacteroidota bacterium]